MSVIAVRTQNKKMHAPCRGAWGDIITAARANRAFFGIALLFLGGMLIGSIYSRSAEFRTLSKLDFLFACNFKARLSQPLLMAFSASFASAFIFVLACFLCGLSMWGTFFIPVIVVFRGFGLGLTSGYLYATYGGKGILYNLAMIMPGAFLGCIAIVMAALEGMRYSRMIAARRAPSEKNFPMKTYLMRFGMILALAFASAALDTAATALFGGCFYF